jgi:two-component system sensor histidine kinase VicK
MNQNSVLLMWNQDQMYERIIKLLENARIEVLAFLNAYTLTISTDNEKFQFPKREARKRGVKMRYITEITRSNLVYCKRQVHLVDELRHLNKVRGNFLMSESEFTASHEVSPQHPITDGFYSNNMKIVELQRHVFESLWDNAIPAGERISQLEARSYTSIRARSAIPKEEKKRVIDRFYVCSKCNSTFMFVDDVKEHQAATGHAGVKEFPFFDK